MHVNMPSIGNYDVVVAGGGLAGVAAAVAARRAGKTALLIEKTISLGGLATIGLVNLFVPMCNGRGVQIIKGMADELLRLSVRYGYDTIPDEWKSGEPGTGAKTRLVSRFSAPIFALALTEFVQDEGVDLLFDTLITRPIMDDNRLTGLVLENKSGCSRVDGSMFVDTTGDADILYRAGVPTVQGNNYHTFYAYGTDLAGCERTLERQDIAALLYAVHGGPSDLFGKGHPEGKPYWKGTDGADVTCYVAENHREILEKIKGQDRDKRDILQLPGMAQFRTTRRIDGAYTLTTEDVYRHFDDSIGAVNDFEHKDFLYEIPYRTLFHPDFCNLITAGRSAAGAGYAWDILRVIPPAILTGQAAGVACALAVDSAKPIGQIDVRSLQNILASQNVMIHFDDGLIPEDRHKVEPYNAGHH